MTKNDVIRLTILLKMELLVSKKNFESSLLKLETVVSSLEGGELSLDESIKKFEEGIGLYKGCKELLGEAEKKISVLTDSLKEEEYFEE